MSRMPKQRRKPKDRPDAGAVIETIHYTDKNGRDYFAEWFLGLRDDKAMAAVASRIARVSAGNFGDCKPLRDGVRELRIDAGPGYRVYYAKDGLTMVLLLCGGDKRSQNRDIDRACDFWREWRERKKEGGK